MNHDVFISYSSKDRTTALAVCHVLEHHRIKCWIAPRDIPGGADYGDVIDDAIIACRVFVIIFSEPASVSQWVKGELNLAFTEGKHIVPYRIDETQLRGAMRLILNQTHWIDAYPDAESKFDELAGGIARFLDIPESASATTAATTAGPAPQPAPQQPAKTYRVGDYYSENGREGVVFEVDATGRHGKIVGMRQSSEELEWCTDEEYDNKVVVGADDPNDGMKNQRKIMAIDGWQEKYPAFAWCAAQGEGWYLPAIGELEKFTRDNAVHDALERLCGMRLFDRGDRESYWSSSEAGSEYAWGVDMTDGDADTDAKFLGGYVRAVSAFNC